MLERVSMIEFFTQERESLVLKAHGWDEHTNWIFWTTWQYEDPFTIVFNLLSSFFMPTPYLISVCRIPTTFQKYLLHSINV